ncbi:hypothetical protein B1B04_13070 [Lysinibacillus sp. KCTC 33748]|uniref:hypothetical protein n=1 Tax=unclassified Lysinibacillus TaxID=2636778 RepID=UPI0009A7C1DF|nr:MULTISPECIES: hypothetical protein [unclassified Lysinibacillus]OXS73213.1 hypothetical protein B1B04_13070 [Lysinibacillus sp. KCTC 33748]SKB82694.1 Carbohydrate binding domain-containing protein [Lysinibacillus sp. AC-3]
MTIILNNTGNPITREERIKINENWDRIIGGLTDLQFQINVLAGGKEVNEILEAIRIATENAIKATENAEEVTALANEAIAKSETATQNAKDATMDALKAKAEADKATAEAIVKIQEVAVLISETKQINSTSLATIKEMQTLITTGNTLFLDLTNLQTQLNSEIANSQVATANAKDAYEKIKGWDTATEWKSTVTYSRNNVVTRNGNTFQSKVNNNTNKPPTTTDENWILLAQRGVDGKGAVGSVNGVQPDENGNVEIDTGLLNAYTKDDTDGLIAQAENKFTSQGYTSNDLVSVTEVEFKDSTISGFKQVQTIDGSFLPDSTDYLGQVIVDIDGAVVTKHYQLVDVILGVTFTRVIRTDGANVISDSEWVKGGGSGSGGKFVTLPLKLKTTVKNQKNWTIPNDSLDLTTDSVLVYFNTVYLRPEKYSIIGSAGTGYKLSFDSPESEIADNNIDIVIFKNVPDLNGLISGTALVDGSVGMNKLSDEVKTAIEEASKTKDAWQLGKYNNAYVTNLGNRSVSKTLCIDGIGGGWNGTDNVETLNITIPFDAQFSGIVKATYTSFWGHSESHGGATVAYRVANYSDRGGVKQADYIIETITDSFAKTYDIKKPIFLSNDLVLPIMKAPLGSMPFMIKLEVDGYIGENKLLFDSVNASTCEAQDTGSPTGGGYPWVAQTSSFLNSTGGTMTGDLVVDKNNASISLKGSRSDGSVNDFIIKNKANDTNNSSGVDMLVNGNLAMAFYSDKNIQFKGHDNVWTSLQDLKQSVVDGKKKVASAITTKGVPTASDATFDVMANNINAISTGKKYASGSVNSSTSPKAFTHANGGSTSSQYYVSIDLPFKPSIIRVNRWDSNGYAWDSYYSYGSDGAFGMHLVKCGQYRGGMESASTYNYQADILENTTTRFRVNLPVLYSGSQYFEAYSL